MKKKNVMTFGQKLAHFFKHYFLLFLLAFVCAVLTGLLIAFCA